MTLKDQLDTALLQKLQAKKQQLKKEEKQKEELEAKRRQEERRQREKNKSFEELLNESNLDWRQFK